MKTRTDAPHVGTDLSYPPKPDNKGYAKRYWERRAYYFGLHNTPESFVLFGEWRKRLIETNEAPDMKILKAELKKDHPIEEPPKPKWQNVLIAASLVLILIGSNVTTRILSTSPTKAADDFTTSLTDEEKDIIIGHRRFHSQNAQLTLAHPEDRGSSAERIARRTAALQKGASNGKEAKEGKEF